MSYQTMVGLRYLSTSRRHGFISLSTWLSMAGVALGVAALIIVMAVMSGFKEGWRDQILGATPHIAVYTYEPEGIEEYNGIAERVRTFRGVQFAGPFIEKQAMLSSDSRVSGAIIKGVNKDTARRMLESKMYSGNLTFIPDLSESEGSQPGDMGKNRTGGIVPGIGLAATLGLAPGDKLTLISPTGTATPMGMIPRTKKFSVAGIYETGTGYDSVMAYISLDSAQSFFSMKGKADGIQVWVDEIMKADEISRRIVNGLGPPFWVRSWKEANKALFAALRWEKIAMFIILALMVLVAAFSVVSTLVMMVMKKGKDIAILKTLGADRASIMKIFTIQGMIIGIAGTGMGAATGLIISKIQQKYSVIRLDSGVYGLDILPINVEYWWGFAFVCIVAVALTFLATIYPSRKAAGIGPLEGLRYE